MGIPPVVDLLRGIGAKFVYYVVNVYTLPPKSATAKREASLLRLIPQFVISKQFWEYVWEVYES